MNISAREAQKKTKRTAPPVPGVGEQADATLVFRSNSGRRWMFSKGLTGWNTGLVTILLQ